MYAGFNGDEPTGGMCIYIQYKCIPPYSCVQLYYKEL